MPVMDEFREEREAIKNGSFKEKWNYFWEYYKWHVIVGSIVLVLVIMFIHDMATKKDLIFYGFFINAVADDTASEKFLNDFIELAELDTENYSVSIEDTVSITKGSYDEVSYTSSQKMTVYLSAGDLDFIAADETTFEQYASADTFMDMRTILSEEQLEKYEQYFYYVDMVEVRKNEEASLSVSMDYEAKVYDHTSAEGLEEPVPVALYINSSEKLNEAYTFTEEAVVIGIPLNTSHLETALLFIDYILD